MSDINRIEFSGRVGYARHSENGGKPWVSLSVRSEYACRLPGGEAVVETTWFNVIAWKGAFSGCEIAQIEPGEDVQVSGRMRCRQYIDATGQPRHIYEVVAGKIHIIEPVAPTT